MRTSLDLPEESQSSLPPRQVGRIIAAVIGLVVLANLAVLALILWHRSHASMERTVVAQKWAHLEQTPRPYDILLVGDSSGLIGVDPEVIAQRTGLSCYNACAFGSLVLVNEAWLLQHLETLGRVPPIVVSIHVHDIWSRDAGMLRRRLGEFPADIRPWERYHPNVLPAERRLRDQISDVIPLVRGPVETQTAFMTLWSSLGPAGGSRARINHLGLDRLPKPDPQTTRRDARDHLGALASLNPDQPALSPINREAFERMVDLLDRHGSSLLVVEAPTTAELAASPLYQADLERNATAVRTLAAGRADFTHAPTGRQGYAETKMQNADHIADDATRRGFSNLVAEHVVEVIARRRSAHPTPANAAAP